MSNGFMRYKCKEFKHTIAVFCAIFTISVQHLNAQTNRFVPYKLKKEVWIYVRPNSTKPIIEEEFQAALPFNYMGLAKVKLEDQWKWIDTTGKTIFNQYDSLQYLRNKDLFVAYKKGKCGIVSGVSKAVLVPLEFNKISVLNFGTEEEQNVATHTSNFNVLDILGAQDFKGKQKLKLIQISLDQNSINRVKISADFYESIAYSPLNFTDFNTRVFSVTNAGNQGLLNDIAKVIVPPNYQDIQLVGGYQLKNGFTFAQGKQRYFIVTKGDFQGLFDAEGQPLLKPIYQSVQPLEFAKEFIFRLQNKADQQGLYFAKTQKLNEPKYITIQSVSGGEFVVCRDKKWIELYTKSGVLALSNLESSELKLVWKDPYKWMQQKDKSMPKVVFKYLSVNQLYGLVSNEGLVLLSPDFQDIKNIGSDRFLAVRKKDRWAFYNVYTRELGQFEFLNIGKMNGAGYVMANNSDNNVGYLYQNTNKIDWIIAPKFQKGMPFNPCLNSKGTELYPQWAAVSQNGKFGFIDPTGNTVLPFEYDSAQSFNGKMGAVKSKLGWQLIGISKKPISRSFKNLRLVSGVALVYNKDSSGIINSDGKWMFPMTKNAWYYAVDHSSDSFPFQRIEDERTLSQVAVISNNGILLAKIHDFVIEQIDSSAWLLLGKSQNLCINAKGEVQDLRQSGEFKWVNEGHRLGKFTFKSGAEEKVAYFDAASKKMMPNLNDWKIEINEESLQVSSSKGGLLGKLSTEFKVILPANYNEIVSIGNTGSDLFIVKNYAGNYAVVNAKNEILLPFDNQFIYKKTFSIETKNGSVNKTIICVKKADKISYFDASMKLIFNNLNSNEFETFMVTDQLFEVKSTEGETLYYTDSKGFRYTR